MPTDLITLTPPELPGGAEYCFVNFQRFAVDIITRTKARLRSDIAALTWNFGPNTPSAEDRVFPWFNTNDGNAYFWSDLYGVWVAKPRVPAGPNGLREIWTDPVDGTPAGLWTFDGGDGTDPTVAGNVTAVTGSFWTVDTVFAARGAIGAGTLADSGTLLTIGATVGHDEITLDKTQMPYHGHNMPQGTPSDPAADYVQVPVYQVGSDWRGNDTPILAFGNFKYEGGDPTSHVTQPFSTLNPDVVVSFVKRTARQWISLPG